MSLSCALNVMVFSMTKILPQYNLQRLTEVLGNLINIPSVLTRVLIFYIRSLHTGTLPRCRKTRMDDTLAFQCLWNDTKQTLQQGSCRDANTITEIPITLPSSSIIITNLTEISWRLSIIHLIQDICFHQSESLLIAARLKIGQCCMHHLGSCYIVNTPRIRHPVAGGNRLISGLLYIDMWDMLIDIARCLESLLRRTSATVNWCVNTPNCRMVVSPFQSHPVLILCPHALFGQPESFIHRF